MSDEEESSSNWTVKKYLKFQLIAFLIAPPLYVLFRFLRPFWQAYWISNWLTEENDYIQAYTRNIHPVGYYRYEVHLTESSDPDILVENQPLGAPVIVSAEREFDPGLLATLDEREEIREFEDEIEWGLTSAPGIHNYRDHEGNSCRFDEADVLYIEYRIYPDRLSQHELITSIIDLAMALRFINHREEKYSERLHDNR